MRFGPGDVSGVHLYAPKRRGTGKFSVSGERVEERGEEVKREQGESDWRRRRNAMMIQVERVKVCCCIRFSHSRELEREKRRCVSGNYFCETKAYLLFSRVYFNIATSSPPSHFALLFSRSQSNLCLLFPLHVFLCICVCA